MKTLSKKILLVACILILTMLFAACSRQADSLSQDSEAEANTEHAQNISPAAKDVNIITGSVDHNLSDGEVTAVEVSSTSVNSNTDDKKEASSKKKIIAIDAGHQSKGNYKEEPIGPGSDITKPKVSSGTQGTYTRVPEYKLTLAVAKKLKKELIKRGYEVVMIRETNDVNLSNKERAQIANESGADIFIRIHADGSDNSKVNGASTLYPSKDNPFVSNLSKKSYALSNAVVDEVCESTGAKNRGAIARDDMSGINWCKIPVTILEMGYMTNKTEDKLMQTAKYQNKIVQGICNGIDEYFK